MKSKKNELLLFVSISIICFLLLLVRPMEYSNDGRHYLAAAESLKGSGNYASLGYSASATELSFLDAWPPIYSTTIAIVAVIFSVPVMLAAKFISLFLFILSTVFIWVNFRSKLPVWAMLGMLIFLLNSGNYDSTNAEVFLFPALLIFLYFKDYLVEKPVMAGIFAGLLYLTKYSFLFILPAVLIYVSIGKRNINYFELSEKRKRAVSVFFKLTYCFIGFLLLYLWWHFTIYKATGNFIPTFLNHERLVNWWQFFPDLVITWNIFPERLETYALLPGVLLAAGIVIFIGYDVFQTYKHNGNIGLNNIFWHVSILGMLSFFLLESVVFGNSTKRYLEHSDLFFYILLTSSILRFPHLRLYRYTALILLLIQFLFFLRVQIPNLPNLAWTNMTENNELYDINRRLAIGEIDTLYVSDLSFAGAAISYDNWIKVHRFPKFEEPSLGDGCYYFIQKRDLDSIKSKLPDQKIILYNR